MMMTLMGLAPIGRPAAAASDAALMAAGRAGERVAERVVPQVMERGGLPAEMLGAMAQGTQSQAVKIAPRTAPQQEALDLAQKRAALPIEQGGLGLPKDNTPEMRAAVMFPRDFAHGSPQSNITILQPSKTGAEGPGIYATDYFPEASAYAGDQPGATVYPLKVSAKAAYQSGGENPYMKLMVSSDEDLLNSLQRMGKDSIIKDQSPTPDWLKSLGVMDMPTREHFVSMNPDLFRSRFAAFDPWRKTAATAALYGVAAPDLLAAEQPANEQDQSFVDSLLKLLGR
jgi:hypothetical protein